MQKLLGYGTKFTSNPDSVMNPQVSADIIAYGMRHGTFTGKSLNNYITSSKVDFVGARRIINGTDKAAKIAGHAKAFAAALLK